MSHRSMTAWLLAAFAVGSSRGDLPVHCLRHQIAGDWEFILSPTSPKRNECGHRRPDNPDAQPALDFVANLGPSSIMQLSLEDPSTASSSDGATGTWTMIYDEAFEVAIKDQVFLAFSSFEWIEDAEKGRRNVSHCDATQVGWYHNKARTQWGCYIGKKMTSDDADGSVADTSDQDADEGHSSRSARRASALTAMASQSSQTFLSPDSDDAPEVALASVDAPPAPARVPEPEQVEPGTVPASYTPWVPKSEGFDNPMPTKFTQSVADALNFLQLGWTATAYDLFAGKTPRELNKFAGVRHNRPQADQKKNNALADAWGSFSSLLGITSKIRRALGGQDAFDWRHKDGHNWLTPVVNQGDCGSCYTISTVHMLTSRHRIKTQDPSRPQFSVSFPLYCSEYNQGCDGGYGFLQSKWSEDVGLVPESCSRFDTGGGTCHALKNCTLGNSRFRAINHHYVGGYYGGAEERLIKDELVARGPVVMSFEPREDFMYYKAGVYKSGPNKIHQEWEQVDHAVLLVGYGEDDQGQAYWTMQNSWGDDWGEGGYFRMARGQDESGCESIVVAAEVLEESGNQVLDDFLAALHSA
mmetsp:Transcript_175374/g.562579  ORF Transcript_175374/g.562579 Transcript_175374/m.562579 type:complete len:584 (-) Transcript_175374:195-1946(-)